MNELVLDVPSNVERSAWNELPTLRAPRHDVRLLCTDIRVVSAEARPSQHPAISWQRLTTEVKAVYLAGR